MTVNKKILLVLATLFTAVLMIDIPLSMAASPSTPSYLAGGSSMNYVCGTSGYVNSHSYSMHSGIGKTTTSNTSITPSTYYYNVTVNSSNSSIANVTVPTTRGTTSYTNVPISDAKYMVPIYISNTSKNVTFSYPAYQGTFDGLFGEYNHTLTFSKIISLPYYKTPFGTVKATEYIIDEHTVSKPATSKTAASYTNITGTAYVNPATNIILGYNINYYKMHVISGTTAANETYTATSLTLTNTLASTNVVPIHTDYTGTYVSIAAALVLLGAVMYYFYGRKPAAPKQTGKQTEKQKGNQG